MTMKSLIAALGLAGLGALAAFNTSAAAERTVLAPMPAADVKPSGTVATAVLAGGCFWGIEAVFSHVKGVKSVVSGYAGGSAAEATYDAVTTERTGHAEAVRIIYDPRVVSYATLLRVFFSVAHDPTQLNRQGPDTGRSYRSAIFPQTPDQAAVARAYMAQTSKSGVWGQPIVTRLESGRFFDAEAYHQDFAFKNPNHGYIRTWDAPKVAAFKRTFPALWVARPSA
ncbi:MAG: peptide-methionine (S)-S-oxide reductase MsrA [Sphingomonadaceae bacterium]